MLIKTCGLNSYVMMNDSTVCSYQLFILTRNKFGIFETQLGIFRLLLNSELDL
jgi:hypothetical protein